MALSSDAVADRRRMRRRLTLWRTLAALSIGLAVVAWGVAVGGSSGRGGVGLFSGGDHVARLKISGVIVSDDARLDALEDVAKDKSAKALILRIDSPGGTFVGSDDLHKAILAVAEKMPVIAVIDNAAASGGYMAALAADRIYARQGSITASIGVIFQSPRVNKLLENIGVSVDVWRSGPLKALPSPIEETPPAAAAHAQAMVDALFVLFLDMAKTRRNLAPEIVAIVRDGRVVIGAEALELGLIDALGDERDARAWLASENEISEDLPAKDITPKDEKDGSGWVSTAMSWVFGRKIKDNGLALSGLLAIWSPLTQ